MIARTLMTAVLIASSATLATAEPAPVGQRPQVQPGAQPTGQPPVVVLAAVSTEVPAVPPEAEAPQPPKKRAARTTTCRCGDGGGGK